MRVYLSGGSDRQRWGKHGTKADVMAEFKALCGELEFVRSGTADYIVIPDEVDAPSATALKTGGKVMHYAAFKRKLQTQKKSGSRRKSVSFRARAPTSESKTDMLETCKVTGENKCRCDENSLLPEQITASLHGLIRKLFMDHVVYTMFYLKSAIFGGPDVDFLLARLLENQTDIGSNLSTLASVGSMKGTALGNSLTEHIKAAGAAVAAAIAYNQKKTKPNQGTWDRAVASLFAQGDELSAVLSSINPEMLPLPVIKEHFHMHNQQVLDLASLLLEHRFADEVRVYDAYVNHMLHVADSIYLAVR